LEPSGVIAIDWVLESKGRNTERREPGKTIGATTGSGFETMPSVKSREEEPHEIAIK